MATQKHYVVFSVLLLINAFLAFLTFALGLQEQAMAGQPLPASLASTPGWVLGLANAALIVVLYGLLGVAGLWFSHKLSLPGVFREHAGWRAWVLTPMLWGVCVGAIMVGADRFFAAKGGVGGLPHPGFPMSLLASATAGIGEEIVFRTFVMGLWAFLLNLLFKRWGATSAALWGGNVIAALAFGAAHLPAVMFLAGVQSPLALSPWVLAEIFVLNGVVALVAGDRYIHDGLVAAVGVHFWADVVWYVIWPLIAA